MDEDEEGKKFPMNKLCASMIEYSGRCIIFPTVLFVFSNNLLSGNGNNDMQELYDIIEAGAAVFFVLIIPRETWLLLYTSRKVLKNIKFKFDHPSQSEITKAECYFYNSISFGIWAGNHKYYHKYTKDLKKKNMKETDRLKEEAIKHGYYEEEENDISNPINGNVSTERKDLEISRTDTARGSNSGLELKIHTIEHDTSRVYSEGISRVNNEEVPTDVRKPPLSSLKADSDDEIEEDK